jgi:alcohol dehydrogenase (cytochrome c)
MQKPLAVLAAALALACHSAVTAAQLGPIEPVSPVTEDELRAPDPSDWLHWRRTADAQGYSPLDQIHADNVESLQLAWAWAIARGRSQPTPLVHRGRMYLTNPGNVIQALEATTGELLWEYERELPEPLDESPNALRGIAIFGDKIFLDTTDAHVVGLDAASGELVWETEVADYKKGFTYTSGPLVADGKIISGIAGCQHYTRDGCFITAHDPNTGKELWRTSTIARPGEPGGDTWGELPWMFRGGGDAWITGSYDPDARLIYWGVSQPKPWARVSRGTDGDALYTSSTLALDPDTGKIVWYHQFIPGETMDMDESFEQILVDRDGKKNLFMMGKLGILWRLDRRTGEFVGAVDLGYQDILDLDPVSGKVTYRAGKIPRNGVKIEFCPSHAGFKSWRAMSYSPETHSFYIPIHLSCMSGSYWDVPREVDPKTGEGKRVPSGLRGRVNKHHPRSGGNLGEFLAMDSESGKVLWRHRQRSPFNSAALATGGGLVFVGDWDRYIHAYDAETGELRWKRRLSNSVLGFPITYAVRGRQYLAVPVGTGSGSWATTIPARLTPERHRPREGNALYVFALPEE